MAGERKNLPASVHQRLLAKAKASSRLFNELLQRFAIERFIYRLSRSPQAGRFVLKGALMLAAWCGAGDIHRSRRRAKKLPSTYRNSSS